jgi:quinol monooxygenase YgiN
MNCLKEIGPSEPTKPQDASYQRQEAVFEERNLKVVEFVRKAEPDVIYRLQRSTTNPSQYVFYEVYPSQAAFDRHVKETLPAFVKGSRATAGGNARSPTRN